MTLAWYDPTNHHVSTDKNDPRFTPLGQLLPLDVPREWVGLTDEQRRVCVNTPFVADQWAYIEAKLKELNSA
jgi:hypothetical protein